MNCNVTPTYPCAAKKDLRASVRVNQGLVDASAAPLALHSDRNTVQVQCRELGDFGLLQALGTINVVCPGATAVIAGTDSDPAFTAPVVAPDLNLIVSHGVA